MTLLARQSEELRASCPAQAIASLSLGQVCSDEDEHVGRHVAHAPEMTQFSFVAALAHLNVWTKP
jgi:hypothetical protein